MLKICQTTLLVGLVAVLSACRGGDGSPQGVATVLPGDIDNNVQDGVQDIEDFFAANVQPALAFCRTCHVPGSIADTAEGRGFMLSANPAEDFQRMQASWSGLGKGVASNEILVQTSQSSAQHTGGTPWLEGSTAYLAVATVLACWDDPANCSLAAVGEVVDELPLLGSAQGGHFWDDFCNGLVDADGTRLFSASGEYLSAAQASLRSDSTALPVDPRDLVRACASDGKAVHFNAFWRDCHAFPELVNEFLHPENCGQFRASVARGSIIMGSQPVVDAQGNPFRYGTNEPYQTTEPSIYMSREGVEGKIIRNGTTFAGDAPHGAAALTAEQYNNLWITWGLPSRPDNFDELVAERYGFGQPSAQFPYPVIDFANGVDETDGLSVTNGGMARYLLACCKPDSMTVLTAAKSAPIARVVTVRRWATNLLSARAAACWMQPCPHGISRLSVRPQVLLLIAPVWRVVFAAPITPSSRILPRLPAWRISSNFRMYYKTARPERVIRPRGGTLVVAR